MWSDKPVSETHTTDTGNYDNWWYANPGATTSTSIQFDTGEITPVYVGVFAFDAADNMSAMASGVSGASPSANEKNLRGAKAKGSRVR